ITESVLATVCEEAEVGPAMSRAASAIVEITSLMVFSNRRRRRRAESLLPMPQTWTQRAAFTLPHDRSLVRFYLPSQPLRRVPRASLEPFCDSLAPLVTA